MEAEMKKMESTAKLKLLAVFAIVMIIASGLIVLYFESIKNNSQAGPVTRVACVGDSITEGFGYPNKLEMMLGNNYTVGNFGVGGSTVLLNTSKPYINQAAMQRAKEYHPDIVVIMLGTNDASPAYDQYVGGFANDYKKLIGEFEALKGKPKIWLVKPPPIFINENGLDNKILVHDVIPRIELTANNLGLPTIDMYAALASPPDYFWDGVHPNNQGVELIASEVYKAISTSALQR